MMEPSGTGRMIFALAVLAALAVAVRFTMESGKYQQLTWLLLGFFAVRVLLGWLRARRIDGDASHGRRDQSELL